MLERFLIFLRILRNEFQYLIKKENLTSTKESHILEELRVNGFYVLENFLPENEVCDLKDEIDDLLLKKDIKIYKDPSEADNRIFGAENLSPKINIFFKNVFLNNLIKLYEKSDNMQSTCLAARLNFTFENKGSGGGWHRDRYDKIQTKAMLYLTDVNGNKGPFQYLQYSHRVYNIILDKLLSKLDMQNTRFKTPIINNIVNKGKYQLKEFNCKAGTVILFDSRGIHRGAPILEGKRYALTLYSWFDQDIPDHVIELMN